MACIVHRNMWHTLWSDLYSELTIICDITSTIKLTSDGLMVHLVRYVQFMARRVPALYSICQILSDSDNLAWVSIKNAFLSVLFRWLHNSQPKKWICQIYYCVQLNKNDECSVDSITPQCIWLSTWLMLLDPICHIYVFCFLWL